MESVTTRLLMVRHGQSTWNQQQRWQGQADPPLADNGRQQAHTAARSVGTVDAVVSSPQQRALETAVIISEALGVGPVNTVEDLRERSAGEWSGLTRDTIYKNWPDWEETGYRPQGWEPNETFLARILSSLNEIVSKFAGGSILVVTHSGVLITLDRHFDVAGERFANLHGRVLEHNNNSWSAAERLQLLDDEASTGGGRLNQEL